MSIPIVGAGDTATAPVGAGNGRVDDVRPGRLRWLWPLIAALLLAAFFMLAIVRLYGPQIERDALISLEITATLKTQQVEAWLTERRRDSEVFSADAELVEHIADIQRKPDPRQLAVIRQRVETLRETHGYPAAHLMNPQGKLLLQSGAEHVLGEQTGTLVQKAISSGTLVQSKFYVDSFDGLAALNFAMPLYRTVAGKREAVGALVLHDEPNNSIFPLILAWPSASPSGETLLVRGEGGKVVYLNQLRHTNNSGMSFVRPMDTPKLPAVSAIRSDQPGTLRGLDYRGIEVLAAYRPIANTDWRLVAKLDYDEAMAPLWRFVLWIGLMLLVSILAIGLLLRRFWSQQSHMRSLAARAQQAQKLRESEARFRAVAETAYDAIITADSRGIVIGWNSSASRMFGFTESEIVGQPLTEIIPPRFRQRAMESFHRMLNGDPDHLDGTLAELTGRRRDNSEFLVERTVALWKSEAGSFYTCTMRDITERKKADEELRIAAAAFESHEGMAITDAANVILKVNRGFTEITGYSAAESVGMRMSLLRSNRHDADFYTAMWARIVEDGTWQGKIWNRNKNGDVHPHWVSISAVRNDRGNITHYVGTYTDISEREQAVEALKNSEEWFRSVFENANTAIASTDCSGHVNSFNEAFRAMLGYDAETLRSMSFGDFTHPDDLTLEMVFFDEMLAHQRNNYRITKRYIAKDGRVLWVDISVGAILDAQGDIANLVGVMHDITETRNQEENTRRLLLENETILNSAVVGIVYLKERRIISCNRRLEEVFKYGPGELIGESSEILYDSRDTFDRVGETAYRVVAEGKNYSTEVRLRYKDGGLFWGALSGRAIDPADPQGGSIWIYADISERRQAEQETSKLLQAVEQSPVSIVITDRRGVIEYVNPCFTRITGYTLQEAVGLTPSVLKTEHTPRATHEELWRTILDGRIWRGTLRNRCKNGDLIWEDTSISPILDATGEITHFVAVKDDVTARKRIEQQLEEHQAHLEDLVLQRTAELSKALEVAKLADKSKDEFLANITHELRTPLSAVIGFSSLARPLSTDPRQRDYLDKVNSAGRTLASIIDDLLDLSKIAAGRLDFETSAFSLRQTVGRSRLVISYKAQEKGLQLVERIEDDVPDVLIGDSLRIEQILLNLLSNAIKFTIAGRVELRVSLLACETQRVCLNIEVEDTGIGLSDEGIALMFKPFSQADASMTRRFGGTGLGLAICKRLAEMMEGEISVTSREGVGSTFAVRLWLGLGAAGDLPAAEERGHASEQVRYRDARVLVVDDQPFNRDVVEGLLAAVGITPRLAEDGQQALDILATGTEAFDLVLMDVQMPVMDGLTATRVIRGLDGMDQLPIIAMTAHTMAHEKEKSATAGMNDHIGKPFDEAGFYRVLAKWIPRFKQTQPAAEPPPQPASASGLPPLPGVDTRAGLALLLGDEARYRHWLQDFITEAPAAMRNIRQALTDGRTEPASMAAHTLKGRMGLLGMKELHAVAAALEAAVDNATPAAELLLNLEHGVAVMCAEIENGLGLATIDTTPAEPCAEPLPPGAPPASIARLIECLQAGDSDCDKAIADCLAELEGTPWVPRLRQALIRAQCFDFAAAGSLLAVNPQALQPGH